MATLQVPHILIVGGGPDLNGSMLHPPGRFHWTHVAGAYEAVAAVRRRCIDVALLDLPGVTRGHRLTLVHRLQHEAADVAVVLVAGSGTLEEVTEALSIGALDYLLKPVTSNELMHVIERAMVWRATRDLDDSAAAVTAMRADAAHMDRAASYTQHAIDTATAHLTHVTGARINPSAVQPWLRRLGHRRIQCS